MLAQLKTADNTAEEQVTLQVHKKHRSHSGLGSKLCFLSTFNVTCCFPALSAVFNSTNTDVIIPIPDNTLVSMVSQVAQWSGIIAVLIVKLQYYLFLSSIVSSVQLY